MNIDLTKLEHKAELTSIINQTINAGIVSTGSGNIETNNSNVIGGSNNSVSISDEVYRELSKLVEELQKVDIENINDKQDVVASIADLQEGIKQKKPHSFFRRILRSLKAIPSIVATHSIEVGIDKLIELLPQ